MLSKSLILKENSLEAIIQEKSFLEYLSHPYITSLKYAFQNEYFIFIVTEFYSGGTLAYHYRNRKFQAVSNRLIQIECISFVAQIADALMYLHRQGIIHKDVRMGVCLN
jgi:serine/threonine protein kinase